MLARVMASTTSTLSMHGLSCQDGKIAENPYLDIFASGCRGGRIPGKTFLDVMFFSCFDDSSDDKRQEYVSAGGLICKEEQWIAFGKDWVVATQHLSEPFRSTDCECQHGQFARWDKKDCDALMSR